MTYSVQDIIGVLPELLLVITALLAILVDLGARGQNPSAAATVSGIGFVAAGIAALIGMNSPGGTVMGGAVFHDGFTIVFRVVFCLIGLFTVMFSPAYLKRTSIRLGEYYSLLVMCVFGMMVMASAANLLLFFIGLEIMSISLYILVGLHRTDPRSVEAGMKYLIMGAFSSAFLLYGIALIFAVVGSIQYDAITNYFLSGPYLGPLTMIAIALMLTGFAFKVAAVPFHFWSPDVYEGAPTTITGFMSTGPKAAAFVVLIRVFGVAFGPVAGEWTTLLSWIAVITMTVGNVTALRQTSIKRMLAYSSVAHAGYLLVGIVAGTHAAFAATGYYLAAYALMNLGAFAVVILLNQREGSEGDYRFDNLKGMGFAHPVLGVSMVIFMLSLTGMPPTAGFFGKLYVFSAAIQQGHIVLAVAGLLNSALAAYYYLRVITLLYMQKAEGVETIIKPNAYSIALIISSILILLIGILPEQLIATMIAAAP